MLCQERGDKVTFKIVRIDESTPFNLRGWKIVNGNGETLQPFSTRREAEKLVEFFGAPIAFNTDEVNNGKTL